MDIQEITIRVFIGVKQSVNSAHFSPALGRVHVLYEGKLKLNVTYLSVEDVRKRQ
jgi:hypothetical protein